MNAKTLTAAAALVAAFGSGPAFADDWAGYYVGIDSLDGSRDHLSIAPAENVTYSVRLKSSKFGACPSAHPSAVVTAVGHVVDGDFVYKDGVLRCDDGNEIALSDVRFKRDAQTGIVAFVPPTGGRTVSLHRISSDATPPDPWAGYHMAIDAGDGSLDGTSIVPNDDGAYAIRVHSDELAPCPTAHPAAHISAVGKVVDGRLVREQTAVKCDGSGDSVSMSDATYIRDPQTGILTLPLPDYDRVQSYHRIGGS